MVIRRVMDQLKPEPQPALRIALALRLRLESVYEALVMLESDGVAALAYIGNGQWGWSLRHDD